MKSPYSKFIKLMLTSERMIVERSGDIYIVSNSYYAVKIPCCDYVSFFQPVSGVFIPLLAGQRFITRNLHEIPKPEEGSTCAKLFQSLNQHIPAAPTPFLIERKTNDGKLKPARIFFTKPSLCNPETCVYILINSDMFDSLKEMFPTWYTLEGYRNSPILSDLDETHSALILPILYHGEVEKLVAGEY